MAYALTGSRASVRDTFAPAHLRFTRYAWCVLGYNIFVIVWGAFVRASGSGAGCGDHWPLCNGQLTPALRAVATLIEFLHRSTSGIDLILVAGLIVWAWRAFPHGDVVRRTSALAGVFLIVQAVLGALLVVFGWVGTNASVGRAIMLPFHLTNMLTLLACLALAAWWSDHACTLPRGSTAWKALAALGSVVLLSITGGMAALADTLYPAKTFAEGAALDFSGSANVFIRLRTLHPAVAVAVAVWLVYFATSNVVRSPRGVRFAFGLAAIVALQLLAGVANVMLAVPVWMQLVHLFLADVLWVTLVLFCANLGERNPVR